MDVFYGLINLLMIMTGGYGMFFIAGGLICGIIAAIIASHKGRSAFGWFLLGCFLNVIGILFIGFMPAITQQDRQQAQQPVSPTITTTPLPQKTASEKIGEFQQSVPAEFRNYVYYYAGSGVAFDVQGGRLFLRQGDTAKLYPKSAIREFQSKTECADGTSSGPGIMVRVADLDHPLWQLRFPNENEQAKYLEIFWEFQEGNLRPQYNTQA